MREELFGLPKEKVLQQLLLILESDDILIWRHYDFNPSNASSSKNVYTTVLSLLVKHYGTKKECESIQKFLSKLLSRDTKNYMFFPQDFVVSFWENSLPTPQSPYWSRLWIIPGNIVFGLEERIRACSLTPLLT